METESIGDMTAVATQFMNKTIPLTRGASSFSEDTELLNRCRAGDAVAFREIYVRHRASVFRIVARTLINTADQEEVTQDVFLQVFLSLSRFKGEAKLSTWIHRVAINVVLQHLRRKRSRIKMQLDVNISDRPQERPGSYVAATPEDRAIQRERRLAVERTLRSLSDKKRIAFVLHDFEGLPAKEISKIVEAPVLTVRTRIFYARKEFYKRLSEEPAFTNIPLDEEAGQ
ncbi:MAG: RNA polymerase sigma factor [Proteobacteria bacterium]|nr:RNA polymerase sigma factor [Pseudomonadota bacterium]